MRTVRARAVLGLARIEAMQLLRSVLVLVGLVAGGLLVWVFVHGRQPVWWNGDWVIGYGQVVLSLTVLIAAQLATARARRDGMGELYDSFPSGAARRTLAHLVGVVGAVPASLVLIGAAAVLFEAWGILGTPDLAVLFGGLLLVLAGGAIGVAIGARFPHPLAGVLGAFVWFVPFAQSNQFNSAIVWLFPWVKPPQLNELPARLAGYPPAIAHALELAAIVVLSGLVSLAITAAARRQRFVLLGAAVAALAAIALAGVAQLRPIPTQDLNHLVSEAANSGSAQHCTARNASGHTVGYCLYPQFGALLPSLQGPVAAVLSLIPSAPARALTISQTSGLSADDPTLTHGHSRQQVAAWTAQLHNAPANLPSSSAIYVNLGSWPARGQQSVPRFDLALGAAEWAVGLPTNTGTGAGPQSNQCVPATQAREAIAIWLAARATYLPSARFQSSSGNYAAVDGSAVLTWIYPGEFSNYFASPGPQTTAAGYLLAQAMTKLPAEQVASVLHATWGTWISPHATNTQLAAALGITMPAVPLVGPRGQSIAPLMPGGTPSQPQCTR